MTDGMFDSKISHVADLDEEKRFLPESIRRIAAACGVAELEWWFAVAPGQGIVGGGIVDCRDEADGGDVGTYFSVEYQPPSEHYAGGWVLTLSEEGFKPLDASGEPSNEEADWERRTEISNT